VFALASCMVSLNASVVLINSVDGNAMTALVSTSTVTNSVAMVWLGSNALTSLVLPLKSRVSLVETV
jgi:hypothetical protein